MVPVFHPNPCLEEVLMEIRRAKYAALAIASAAMLGVVLVAFAFYRRNETAPAEVLEANAVAMEG